MTGLSKTAAGTSWPPQTSWGAQANTAPDGDLRAKGDGPIHPTSLSEATVLETIPKTPFHSACPAASFLLEVLTQCRVIAPFKLPSARRNKS